jgi:hypothetical protein
MSPMSDSGSLELARRIEPHEATVWGRCIEAADRSSQRSSSPLRCATAVVGSATAFALDGLDSVDVNRVLGLGLDGPPGCDDVDSLLSVYGRLGLVHFQVEVPAAAAPACAAVLETAGLIRQPRPIWTIWRGLDDLADTDPATDVRVLGPADRTALTRLQATAWGVWEPDALHHLWFGAPLGTPDFTYFGLFQKDELVSVAALEVDGTTAWAGFDATLPRLRHRQLRQAAGRHRLRLAADLGCDVVHADTYHPPKRRTWRLAYEKVRWVSAGH